MFLDNKYTKVYNKIIEKSKNRAIFGYKENHHIVPRCLGGGDKNSMFGRSAPKENNLKWYTNGTKDIYVTEGTQPLGFLRGRSSVKGNKNPLKNKETAMKLSKTRTTLQRNYLEDGSFTMVGRV